MASSHPRGYQREPFFSSSYHPPHIDRSSIPSPFRIDEGFSEETQPDSDIISFDASERIPELDPDSLATNVDSLRAWLLAQPIQLRATIARDLLASMPTSLLAGLVTEANARLHFDPIRCLPKEIISSIFEHLDLPALLSASLVSHLWTSHASEPRLWKRLFGLEGWTHQAQKIRSFENTSLSQIRTFYSLQNVRQHFQAASAAQQLRLGRLFRQGISTEGGEQGQTSRLWVEEGTIVIPSTWPPPQPSPMAHSSHHTGVSGNSLFSQPSADQDEQMQDAPDADGLTAPNPIISPSNKSSLEPVVPFCPLLLPPYLADEGEQKPQPNWRYLYKQRRRLEQNWTDGRFTPFRLPHPKYPGDSHEQCVYTIQFSSKYVVSGSRDKSVRVWDLSTQRLKMLPLLGHDGSVLCVQFDERPEQDVIISGSSDADVIVWRFSTGGMIKRLSKAHAESVLNLRFDERYLVTCSKDKTIKLWNRRELLPTDPEYPQTNQSPHATYPQYIVDIKELQTTPRPPISTPLMPYNLLVTFNEHNAAVNAIQIHGNEIVSASGDRKIMLWDIPSGRLIRTFTGHSKGIACVQYDGRRIISGSSDNSIRIFDSATAAEVAVLDGHKDLVRTVQADFGDVAGDEAILELQARQNDQRIMENKRMEIDGEQTQSTQSPPPLNEHFVLGAKLPPSGGGSRFSKIVSGSYDETVIIWRKDKDGQWVPAKELRQEDAIKATEGPARQGSEPATINFDIRNGNMRICGVGTRLPFPLTSPLVQIFQKAKDLGMPHSMRDQDSFMWIRRNLLIGRPVRGGVVQFYRITSSSNAAGTNRPINHLTGFPAHTLTATLPGPLPPTLHPSHPHFQYHISSVYNSDQGIASRPDIFHHIARQLMDPQIQTYFQHQFARAVFAQSSELRQFAHAAPPTSVVAQATVQGSTQQHDDESRIPDDDQASSLEPHHTPESIGNAANQPPHGAEQPRMTPSPTPQRNIAAPPPNQDGSSNPQAHTLDGGNASQSQATPQQQQQQQQQQQAPGQQPIQFEAGYSRVFKLQFDSRRIICCSQQPVMVGWDFANGDKDIEEASQFFD